MGSERALRARTIGVVSRVAMGRLQFLALVLACGVLTPVSHAAALPPGCRAVPGPGHVDDPATGPVALAPPESPRPQRGEADAGARFPACVIRATDHRAQPGLNRFVRVAYSRTQAFNADDSLVLVVAGDGMVHALDTRTFELVHSLEEVGGVDGEPQWHPAHPGRLRYFPRDNRAAIAELELDSGRSRTLVDFSSSRLPWSSVGRVTTRWEGSPSADGRYWCLMVYDDQQQFLGISTFDLEADVVLAHRAMERAPDHVSMSPSGRHCVVAHVRDDGGTRSWSRDLSGSRLLHVTSEHSDLAIGARGEDYFVFVDYDTDGVLYAMNLDSGERIALLETYLDGSATAYHVSARNHSRPGWVVLSTYASRGPPQWLHERVIAVELSKGPRIINLAHHRSRFSTYWTAPTATANRDLTRVLFNSNWGTGRKEDMDVYMIVVPGAWLERP